MKQFGIDLGGTKIEGVVLDGEGRALERRRILTEQEGGYDRIVGNIVRLLRELEAAVGEKARTVGMGTPGTINPPTGLLKNSNTVVLNGKPLGRNLEERTGIKWKLANDANCFAIAEALLGVVPKEVPGAEVVFGVILGTGVGGGIVVNGRVLGGAQGIGGEWGHQFLDHSSGQCYCGRVGCAEGILSGPAVERYYANRVGERVTMQEIVRRYRAGGDHAGAAMERWFHFFAKGMGNVINLLDPDVVVLGGGLGNIEEVYSLGVPRVAAHLFNPRMETVFLRPGLGDSAGVFGAALLK